MKHQVLKSVTQTCPRVKRVQSIIQENTKLGYSTIIVGDEGHAEVTGLLGYTDGNGYVVSSPGEVSELPDMEKICIVCPDYSGYEYLCINSRETKT